MNYFDDEERIVSKFQSVDCSSIYFPNENNEAIAVLNSIYCETSWSQWKNTSGKSDPPPDFYCEELQLMMDVMRIDDHAVINKHHPINTNSKESNLQNELRGCGLEDAFPNVNGIFVNAVTDLPTCEDHAYSIYLNNFKRIISKHLSKVENYNNNHPGYKIIFFIMDESSEYFQVNSEKDVSSEKKEGQIILGKPHFHFIDREFLNVFVNAHIDYVIWFTPFKYHKICKGILDLPKVCFFDLGLFDFSTTKYYPPKLMVSSEV